MTPPLLVNAEFAAQMAARANRGPSPGHPEIGPTPARSNTRFVLPFAYRLDACGSPALGGGCFEPARPGDWILEGRVTRERYLTEETADVIFQSAQWFVARRFTEESSSPSLEFGFDFLPNAGLREDDPRAPRQTPPDRRLRVRLLPPAMVLFEYRDRLADSAREDDLDPLRTGFLVLQVEFADPPAGDPAYQGPSLHDLLRLNELFRHWLEPFAEHRQRMQPLNDYLERLKEMASQGRSPGREPGEPLETGHYLWAWEYWLRLPLQAGKNWVSAVPGEWLARTRAWANPGKVPPVRTRSDRSPPISLKRGWAIYADDRAYVWTCALLPESEFLKVQVPSHPESGGRHAHEEKPPWPGAAEKSDRPIPSAYWVRLLNVDDAPSNSELQQPAHGFERDWVEEHTYWRWAEGGGWYGFNYHAAAMLSTPRDEPPTWQHWQQMYFDQTLLLLYIRVSLFRFSVWINRVTRTARDRSAGRLTGDVDGLRADFAHLRTQFAFFTNLYQFPLLSNQQQGLEMYQLAREVMDAQELYEEIRAEIQETDEVLDARAGEVRNDLTERLTVVATIGLILSLVLSVFAIERLFKVDSTSATGPGTNSTVVAAAQTHAVPALVPTTNATTSLTATPPTAAPVQTPAVARVTPIPERLGTLRANLRHEWLWLGSLLLFWTTVMILAIAVSGRVGGWLARLARKGSPFRVVVSLLAVALLGIVAAWLFR